MKKSALVAILAMVILAVAGFAKAEIIDVSYVSGETEVIWKVSPGDNQGKVYKALFSSKKIDWEEAKRRVSLPKGINSKNIQIGTKIKIVGKNGDLNYLLPKNYLSDLTALKNLQKEAEEMRGRIAELEVSIAGLEVKNSNLNQMKIEAFEMVEISGEEVRKNYQIATDLKQKNMQLEKNLQKIKIAIRSVSALLLAAVSIWMFIFYFIIVKNPVRQEPPMTNKITQTLPQGAPAFLNLNLAKKNLAEAQVWADFENIKISGKEENRRTQSSYLEDLDCWGIICEIESEEGDDLSVDLEVMKLPPETPKKS